MRTIYILIFLFLSVCLSAQEVITGLQFNPVIKAQFLKYKMQKSGNGEDTIPITLPFFDDFSSNGVFPSSLRWIDRYGFENTDYPVYPIDRGVVTLDAINDTGSMYPNAVGGPDAFIADHLTSRYLRLDSVFSPVSKVLSPSDSVYLSFYYQPQGRGLPPHTSDSLVVQFLLTPNHDSFSPVDTTHIADRWRHIWSVKGMALDSFYMENNLYFKRVMIPITDTTFFKKKFRLQFYNYVSLAGSGQPSWQSNCSQWNIDEVYLNYGRNLHDTIHQEIRFVERPPSLLKYYQSMPYTQFCNNPSNEMIDSLSMILTNRDVVSYSVKYSYHVTQPGGNFSKRYESNSINLLPYNQYAFGYVAHPPVTFTFPISTADSTLFEVEHVVRDLAPGSTLADTITGSQPFYNYYAYDDGTPEAGYGLKGTGAQMAYRFKLNKSPDTLRAIRIYFNHTLEKSNIQFFYLTVWNDNSGFPGDTIYSRIVLPQYSDSLNKFTQYLLEKPVRISGTFYIGTVQTTDDNLNIGLDTYDNSAANLFFNVTGSWIASSITGAPMVRPVIGKPLPLGIANVTSGKGSMKVYPNPCSTGQVHISMDESGTLKNKENWTISISGLTGQRLYHSQGSDVVDVSGLPSGIYIIEARNTMTLQHLVSKLVIMK
ncbi:MAG: T9SS C-terminal target domain-containing protein [Bacteroidetes bacterium]|nr:MAG: T9SS C-terminal target domain-containing protein [Bacteroidota bacterium]